jgi:hypothetical protein
MPEGLAVILVNLLSHIPQVIEDTPAFVSACEDEFNAIAHGEGGAVKIQKAVNLLQPVFEKATKIAADAAGAP